MNEYDDIINLPHHVSSRHPQMSMMNRAAQFAPFAALTGHAAAIEDTARLTDEQHELADEDSEALNQKLAYLRENLVHLPTWEYIFNSFMYTSFICREDNVWNRSIHEYLTGEDALIESERIEEEIMNISIDMWEY